MQRAGFPIAAVRLDAEVAQDPGLVTAEAVKEHLRALLQPGEGAGERREAAVLDGLGAPEVQVNPGGGIQLGEPVGEPAGRLDPETTADREVLLGRAGGRPDPPWLAGGIGRMKPHAEGSHKCAGARGRQRPIRGLTRNAVLRPAVQGKHRTPAAPRGPVAKRLTVVVDPRPASWNWPGGISRRRGPLKLYPGGRASRKQRS